MLEALALSLKQALINAVNSTNSKADLKHKYHPNAVGILSINLKLN